VIAGKTHAPESHGGFGKFQFHIAADVAVVLGLDDLADHFFFGSFIGEEQQLSRSNGGRKTDHRPGTKNEYSLGRFGERFAFVAAFHGARAIDGNRNFQRDSLLPWRGFGGGHRR